MTPAERFECRYMHEPMSGCWLWMGHCNPYGLFAMGGQRMGAHRAAWLLHRGEIPAGLWVLHRCDVPACVNPDHLFLGSSQDNIADRDLKGRQAGGERHWARMHPDLLKRGDEHPARLRPDCLARGDRSGARRHPERRPRGEKHVRAKLTVAAVTAIRDEYAAGVATHASLARRYGVNPSTIGKVLRGIAWRGDA